VTVTYNSAKDLREFSLEYRVSDPKWVVVDNDSSDDTIATALSLGAINPIILKSNVGFSKANNIGLSKVETPYVAFVNPDVSVNLDSLASFDLSIFENGSIAAPQLLSRDGSKQPNGRNFPFLIYKISNRVSFLPAFRENYQMYSQEMLTPVAWLTGAVVMGKTETFRKFGGWPEKYFLYHEDADLCMSIRSAGDNVQIAGEHQWVHGWKRETSSFRLKPWMRETSSLLKFYLSHPVFILLPTRKTLKRVHRRYGEVKN
jgi:GT2 family glycosyltransferase